MKELFTPLLLSFLLSVSAAAQSGSPPETYDSWMATARIGGLALEPGAAESEIDVLVAAYRDQGVNVIELDSGLSNYLDAAGFAEQVAHIDLVAQRAQAIGLRVVIYYPSLEVLTPDGSTLSDTMGKTHADWVQVGLNGTPNIFYGTQEHWVPEGAESAWLSANSTGYRNYFIGRVEQLAATAVDGIWIDVPLYLDTGVQWSDIHPEAVAAFEAWSADRGYGYSGPPAAADMTDQKFRHWLQWRNDNLADFIDTVRASALAANPDWAFVTEVYPLDYLDTIWTGLEPAVLKRADNSIVVWELDGVSDSLGMEYANYEDFSNLIAMSKVARALDRDRPGWGFSYGNQSIDAGLVMAATIAARLSPFETKTPIMTASVGPDFRTRWFEFIAANEEALLKTDRIADVGIWFSPATKTFHDFAQGGVYGMYLDQNPPPGAESWWSTLPELSLRRTDHLAGWRGAAYALNELHVPYKAVVDPGDPVAEMEGLSLMWLPSVVVLSEDSAQMLREFVSNGGTLLATGLVPGTMDEHGVPRASSLLADVFGFTAADASQGPRMQTFGSGVAIFRPDIRGVDLFETGGEPGAAALKEKNHGQIEQIVRIHTPDRIIADEVGEAIHITVGEASATEQHVFVLNYSGLQKPAVNRPTRVPFHYRAPDGQVVTGAEINMPGAESLSGPLDVIRSGRSTWQVEPLVNQFAIVTFQLAPDTTPAPAPPAPLTFSTQERADAVADALAFVVDSMRHTVAPAPYSYGIHTNLLDNNDDTAVYTGGHHVTDEHMGLFLRVTALLQDQTRFDEALAFLETALYARGYNVLAWSMHKDKLKPFLQPDLLNDEDVWMAANAPLDDLRAIRGLLDGAIAFGQPETGALGHTLLDGLYWTSVTDRLRGQPVSHPQYPGGIVGYSWDWEDHDDPTLTPPAKGSGLGRLGSDLIPVDYQDLGTLAIGARENPRLRGVLASAVDMMLASEIPGSPGLFYNGLMGGSTWTGDFEYQGEARGNNLKVIQELWTALHLARVSQAEPYTLDTARRQAAGEAALRSYNFFKGFYLANGNRVPEYLTFQGTDVPDGNTGNNLVRGVENLFNGEARIYSQLARLALLMDDDAFAASVIEDRILTDRVTDPASPLFGFIGASTASTDDAEAFNVLESLLTLCLEAQATTTPGTNNPPTANDDTLSGGLDTALLLSPVDLLGNDTDPDDDILIIESLEAVTSAGGTIAPQGSRWIYTPPSGFLGNDSFSYTMGDGTSTASATATIEVTEGGGIALEITRDGDLSDWPATHFVATDPEDISGAANLLDLRELHLTVQDNKLFVAYVNEGPLVYNWGYTLYFDTDRNPATGYQLDGIGAEIIIQEDEVQSYTGTGFDWSWQTIAIAPPAIRDNVAELSVPLGVFGPNAAVRMRFVGDNLAYEPNGSGQDLVPEPNPSGQWIHYDFVLNEGTIGDPPTPPVNGIDGDLSDWPAHFVALDPDDVSGGANKLDLRELHVRAADGKLFLGYVNEEAVDYNYAYLLYLDTDSDPSTGFGFWDLGADFIIQDNLIHAYTGTGANWSWAPVAPVNSAVLGDTVELCAELSALGNPFSMRLQFYGDNGAYGGTTIDLVPDTGGPEATYIQFTPSTNAGSIGGTPPPPNADTDGDGIPDAWESANGLNPDDINDGGLDKDGDRLTNLDEYIFGTSPSDASDFFAVTTAVDPTFSLSAAGKAGRSYTLQQSTSGLDGPWVDIVSTPTLATDQNVTLTDPAAVTGSKFYRMKVTVTPTP